MQYNIYLKRKLDFNKLEEGFKDIFNKGNSNINDVRRDLIHLIIVLVVLIGVLGFGYYKNATRTIFKRTK